MRNKEILLSGPVHKLLGVALGALEDSTATIARTYGETVEIGNAHHENGPEEFWREELSRALSKLQYLKDVHKFARVYEPSTDLQRVLLGGGVRVTETLGGEESKVAYTVVSAIDITVCARLGVTHPKAWLNEETTRGLALLNRRAGERGIKVKVPDGEMRMDITDLFQGNFDLELPTKLAKNGESK